MAELVLEKEVQNSTLNVNGESSIVSQTASERLSKLPLERQKAVKEFALKINVLDNNIVTSYGNVPLKKSADVNGEFLEKMANTEDDKAVVEMITKLSEATNNGQHEIEILAKPPSFFQRLYYIFTGKSRDDEIKIVVKNTYQIVTGLQAQMEKSIETLIQRAEDGKLITKSNSETAMSLEEYLVAGYIALSEAEERCKALCNMDSPEQQIAKKQLESGIRQMSYQLSVLEQAKATSIVSAVQAITDIENMNTTRQMIQSKTQMLVTLVSQLGSSALLNNTTKRIHESQKTIEEMSKAMMIKVSQDTADTTVAIAESFSKGVLDVETILKCMDIMHKGFEDANNRYHQFFEKRDSELVKLKEAEEKMLPTLEQAIKASTVSDEVMPNSRDSKLVI